MTTHDPLAGKPKMHVWRDCVWAAQIPPMQKLVLLCIGRYMDGEGKRCSMSFAQMARECNIHESTAKSIVGKLVGVWLHKVTAGGRLIPGVGRENLYQAMTPQSVVEVLRQKRLAELQAKNAGVVSGDPDRSTGVVPNDTYSGWLAERELCPLYCWR